MAQKNALAPELALKCEFRYFEGLQAGVFGDNVVATLRRVSAKVQTRQALQQPRGVAEHRLWGQRRLLRN